MTERDWKVLLDSLERGRCIAVIGPGIAVAREDGAYSHLATTLSRRLAEVLQQEKGVDVQDPDDFPLVAEAFRKSYSRSDLEVEVRDFYTKVQRDLEGKSLSAEALADLAVLPISLFVSARHDYVLEHYLKEAHKPFVRRSYAFRGNQETSLGVLGTAAKPLVYHLVGSMDDPESQALTECDLLDLLKAIASGNPGVPADLLNALRNSSVLFLGCSLHEYYARVLLHILGVSRSEQRSFAMEWAPTGEEEGTFIERVRKGVWFYGVAFERLKLLEADHGRFVREMRRVWDERHPPGTFTPPEAPVGDDRVVERPRVFISYMTEDREEARQLRQALERNGIDPWIDEQGIRGGDRWPNVLQDAIEKEVDFFLVLLTKHLSDDVETVVHQEIERALKRQSRRGSGSKFVYPLQRLDSTRRLGALDREQIQAWPLRDFEAGVADLAADIRKQFSKLQRR